MRVVGPQLLRLPRLLKTASKFFGLVERGRKTASKVFLNNTKFRFERWGWMAFLRIAFGLLLISSLPFFSACTGGAGGTGPGEAVPEVTGLALDGKPAALYEHLGKVTLINFWATWCAPCVSELPALQRLYDQERSTGFRVVGIALDDTAEEVQRTCAKLGISFPIVIDIRSRSKRLFGLRGVPESFFVDEKGRVLVVTDPTHGSPVPRLVGPRPWDSSPFILMVRKLMGAAA
jgi:thiol-disulfide isomerase/thioredoxin